MKEVSTVILAGVIGLVGVFVGQRMSEDAARFQQEQQIKSAIFQIFAGPQKYSGTFEWISSPMKSMADRLKLALYVSQNTINAFVEMKRNGCVGLDPKDLAGRRDCDKYLGNIVLALRDELGMRPVDVNMLIEFMDIKNAAEEFQRRRTLGAAEKEEFQRRLREELQRGRGTRAVQFSLR